MTYYNLTFLDNSTGFLSIAQGVNDNSGGWAMGLLLLFFWIVMYMSFTSDVKSNLMASSFLTSLVAMGMFGAGLLYGWVVVIPIVFFLFTLMAKVWGDA